MAVMQMSEILGETAYALSIGEMLSVVYSLTLHVTQATLRIVPETRPLIEEQLLYPLVTAVAKPLPPGTGN